MNGMFGGNGVAQSRAPPPQALNSAHHPPLRAQVPQCLNPQVYKMFCIPIILCLDIPAQYPNISTQHLIKSQLYFNNLAQHFVSQHSSSTLHPNHNVSHYPGPAFSSSHTVSQHSSSVSYPTHTISKH